MGDGDDSGTIATVVLGFREDKELFSDELQGRMNSGLGDYLSCQGDHLLLSGGPTPKQPVPESSAMGIYAAGKGIPWDSIYNEVQSESTIQNALYIWELLDREDLSVDALRISTSEWHSERAVFTFEQIFSEDIDIEKGVCFQSNHPASEQEKEKLVAYNDFFAECSDNADPYEIAQMKDINLGVGRTTSLIQD